MFNTSVYFNNFNLGSLQGVYIVNYNVTDMPARNLNISKLARRNRSLLTSAEYAQKDVTVEGFVGGDNWIVQQQNFDRLKSHIQDVEGIIRVVQGTSAVEYTGTLNGISKNRLGPNLGFTLTFKCANPIGRDFSSQSLFTPTTITTSTISKPLLIEGTFDAEPRFNITINSVTGGTNKSISLLNAATGKGIKITRNYVAGDIISIASDTMEVVANTQLADFKGQFPQFPPGARTLQYIDDFTARNVTITATYNRRYA